MKNFEIKYSKHI